MYSLSSSSSDDNHEYSKVFLEPVDALPNCKDVLEDVYSMTCDTSNLFELRSDSGALVRMARDQQALKDAFLRRLRGKTRFERWCRYLWCAWHKSELVMTLESVTNTIQSCYASATFGDITRFLEIYLLRLPEANDLDFVAHTAGLKLLRMMNLCYALECRKFILESYGLDVVVDRPFGELPLETRAVLAVKALTQPPPAALLGEEHLLTAEEIAFSQVQAKEIKFDANVPFHIGWTDVCILRFDAITDRLLMRAETQPEGGLKFRTQDCLIGSMRCFMSSIKGVLDDQLEVAKALQIKILGSAWTLLMFLLSVMYSRFTPSDFDPLTLMNNTLLFVK